MSQLVQLEAGGVRATVDPERGARLVSLTFDGHEVIGHADSVAEAGESIGTGCYPMVPWAGRIRGGLVAHQGRAHALPVEPEGNALHGLGRDLLWSYAGDGLFIVQIGDPWPEPGTATLQYSVRPDGVDLQLEWKPDHDTGLGCALGFHPWFRRVVDGVTVQATLTPTTMVERGSDGLPTGDLVDAAPPPWDDCLRLAGPPQLSWPGVLDLQLTCSSPWWVVFSEPRHAICVEPQTVPPDSWSHPTLGPSRPSQLTFSITRT